MKDVKLYSINDIMWIGAKSCESAVAHAMEEVGL